MRVLTGGAIHTMVGGLSSAEAVAYDRGVIVAVGRADEVLHAAGPDAEVVDLGERAVLPGFIDAHHHISLAALYGGAADCRPPHTRSIDDLARRLRDVAASLPKGEWVLGHGYDDRALRERRHPTRADLDKACPDHPAVAMHFSYHACVANSRALELAGIGRGTPDPAAGWIERGRRGEPTGRLLETATAPVETAARQSLLARDGQEFTERLLRYQEALFAVGITRIADPTVPPGLERLLRQAHRSGDLRVPLIMMPVSESGYLLPPSDRLDGAPTGEGSDELRVGPLKLFFDGGENCAMCLTARQAMRAALQGVGFAARAHTVGHLRALRRIRPRIGRDLCLRTGVRYFESDAPAVELATRAVERGFGLAIHAMGNEAVAQAVRVIERVRGKHRDTPPPRIEHAIFATEAPLERAAALGIAVVTQPAFVSFLGADTLPPLPGLRVLPIGTMNGIGVRVAASSDAPVLPFDPMDGVRAAVLRRAAPGRSVMPEEAVDARAAIGMYTREAAHACGCLDTCGTIEPGKRADLVILSADPCHLPVSLRDIRVAETVLGGETVYRAEPARAAPESPAGGEAVSARRT
jgi:predicted amidohydrolase YtcJ